VSATAVVPPPAWGIAACLIFGALAIVGAETGRKALVVVFKPAATLALLPVVGFPPADTFAWLIDAGIVLSLVGDVALIGDGDREFLVGTVAFLGAHVCYTAAFFSRVAWDRFPPAALLVAIASVALVVLVWRGAGALRPAIVVYALAITVMVVAALATTRGELPARASASAAVGALLFYASDSSLAIGRFRRPIPHGALVTLATYWLGQIGIALAARWS
jgi:uncharacterized membrane protein YhhN